MMDADVHIWMMHHQQGRLLCQGMRSKRSLQGLPAMMQMAVI